MGWNYAREESKKAQAGDYRFECLAAEEQRSKSGKNMIVVSLKLNGAQITVKDYFVEGEWFNRKATSWFDSTNIEEGNFNLPTWVGAVGAAKFKEDENGYLKVHYYLDKRQQERLPAWQGPMPERQTVTEFSDFDDENLPF